MNPLLIALLGVMLLPLFAASWRLSIAGLAGQGFVMGMIAYQANPGLDSVGGWVDLVDLVVIRGLVAPFALYTVLRAQRTAARNDILPPNLMSWTLAIVIVLLAFRFGDLLVATEGDERSLVAVATAGLLLGMLVLATQKGVFSQIVGVLRIENAIALFELGGDPGDEDGGMRVARTGILLGTVLLCRWYLRTLPREPVAKPSAMRGVDT